MYTKFILQKKYKYNLKMILTFYSVDEKCLQFDRLVVKVKNDN